MNKYLARLLQPLNPNRNRRRKVANRDAGPFRHFQSLEDRALLSVTTTYGFDFVQNTDLTLGPATSQADATSLANGGFAVSSTNADGETNIDIFNADLSKRGSTLTLEGINSAIDQTQNAYLVVVTQNANSILYGIRSRDNTVVLAQTDLGVTGSANPDVAGLNGGHIVIVYEKYFGGVDYDIYVNVRNSAGGAVTSFVIDSSLATDVLPSVAKLDAGGFAVAWQRILSDGSTEIWYAIYEHNGAVRKAAAETDTLTEVAGQGTDTRNFSSLTTAVNLNLGLTSAQAVHTNRSIRLNSGAAFENARGGSAGDTLL